MNVYVVCMDSYYVRDAQMFDPEGLSEKELNETRMAMGGKDRALTNIKGAGNM